MTWIGWQEGMAGVPVRTAKEKLRAKFSYAAGLDDSLMFTRMLTEVLVEYQTRKNADPHYTGPRLRCDGVLDFATRTALGTLGPQLPPKRIVLFTVTGTGVNWNFGYPYDLARWQDQSRVYVQPVGYPGAVFPMGPSSEAGELELVRLMHEQLDGPNDDVLFMLIGYSQGAMVTSRVLRRMMGGDLTYYFDRCIGGVTFGNPLREAGHFTGDTDPGGHGLDPDCLTDTPPWWHDYAAAGDIYTCGAPDDADAMEDCTAIYLAVQGHLLTGRDNLGQQIREILLNPIAEVPAAVRAITLGWEFITAHPPTAPHIEYHIRQCYPGVTYFDHAFGFVRRTIEARRRLTD